MRLTTYIGVGLRDILRQPVRSSLTIIAVIISTVLFITLVSLGIESRNTLIDQITHDDTSRTVWVSPTGSNSGGLLSSNVQIATENSVKIDDQSIAAIRDLPNVASAQAQVVVWELQRFKITDTDKEFVSRTTAVNPADTPTGLATGVWLEDNTIPQVVLGNSYARALGYGDNPEALVGRDITFTTARGYRGEGATIPQVGATRDEQTVFASSSTTLTATIRGVTTRSLSDNQIYIPMAWARRVQSPQFATPTGITRDDNIAKNGYSGVAVRVDDNQNVRSVTNAIQRLGYGASSSQKQIDQINQIAVVVWIILGAVALVSMFSAILGIINILMVAINEQRPNIQIWRACGASRGLIMRIYIIQAMLIGLIGSAIGGLIGYIISHQITDRITQTLAAQNLDALIIPAASWQLVGLVVVVTIILTGLISIYPSRRAARRIFE